MTSQIKKRIEQIQRGEVPQGYKKTKVGIVPSEWNENILSEYLQEHKQLSNDIEKHPVYSSSRQGLVPQSQYYDNREAVETNLGYKIVPDGYVTYRHMSDDDVFHFNINNTGGKVLVSSEYPVFTSTSQGCLEYIIPMLNEMARFRYFCRTQKKGGTRTRLYYKNLCTYKSAFPPLAEQEKIAEILSTQDKLIELNQRKIEELEKLKRYYLSKMFPQKDANVPDIRFKSFTEPWEQRELREIANRITRKNQNLESTLLLTISAHHGLIDQNEFFDKRIASKDVSGYYLLERGEFAYNRSYSNNAPWGTVKRLDKYENGVLSTLYIVFKLRDNVKIDSDFIASYYDTNRWYIEVQSIAAEGARNHGLLNISSNDFFKTKLMIPKSIMEQQLIGTYFKELNHLIALHQIKCEELKKHKKALMQLLLTGIVRVKT